MNRFLDPSMQKKRKLLDNAYEACELMISHGAHICYQRVKGIEADPWQKYLTANDVFLDVFPGDARKLILLFGGEEESKKERQWCIIM